LTAEDLTKLERTYRNSLGEAINETTLEQMLVDTGAYERARKPRVKALYPTYENKMESEK
jgi:hypothetical protein